jgi:hypothetical protein
LVVASSFQLPAPSISTFPGRLEAGSWELGALV